MSADTNTDLSLLQCLCVCNNGGRDDRYMKLSTDAYQSLSLEDQRRVCLDLYGIEESIEETPEFVEGKLIELDNELDLLQDEIKKYYMKALEMEKEKLLQQQRSGNGGEEYVGSARFRLMFLRSELFDARLAARRLAAYFKEKYDLFGEERLAFRIKQSDLSEGEKMALLCGTSSIFVGTTDLAGRPVLVDRRSNILGFNALCLKRIVFYTFQRVVENSEIAQKKGVVFIGYNMGSAHPRQPSDLRKVFPVIRMAVYSFPVRLAGYHNFYEDLKEHFAMNLILVVLPKKYRTKYLTHFLSTHEECMMSLMSYGINPDLIPLAPDGSIQHHMIRNHLDRVRQLEERKI